MGFVVRAVQRASAAALTLTAAAPPDPSSAGSDALASQRRSLRAAILALLLAAAPADAPTPHFLEMVAEAADAACSAPSELDPPAQAAALALLRLVGSAAQAGITPEAAAAEARALSSLARAALSPALWPPAALAPPAGVGRRRRRSVLQASPAPPSPGKGALAAVTDGADLLAAALSAPIRVPGSPMLSAGGDSVQVRSR